MLSPKKNYSGIVLDGMYGQRILVLKKNKQCAPSYIRILLINQAFNPFLGINKSESTIPRGAAVLNSILLVSITL